MSVPARRVPRDDARPSSTMWPRLPASFVAVAVALVLAAALAGWVGRTVSTPVPAAPPPRASLIDLGPLRVAAPGAWAPERTAIKGMEGLPTGASSFAPVPGLAARAVVSLAPFDDPTLVPVPLRTLVTGAQPRRAKLAGLPAWTYPPHELAGGRMAQVTVSPTTAGSLTVVCIAPAAAWSGAARCAEGLAGASFHGAESLVPSPTLAFRRHLAPVVEHLGARRAHLRARLRGATTRRGQARLAGRLGRAHGRAAAALAPSAPAAGAPRRVVRLLRANARSYGRLSVAARRGWPVRYRRARAAIRRTDRALARTVARVH